MGGVFRAHVGERPGHTWGSDLGTRGGSAPGRTWASVPGTPGGATWAHVGGAPPAAVRFGLGSVSLFDEGRAYTEQEHREWLDEAGFGAFRLVTLPDGSGIITARKPA